MEKQVRENLGVEIRKVYTDCLDKLRAENLSKVS